MKKLLLILNVFLISILSAFSQVASISPNSAFRGQSLSTTITLANGVILNATAPLQNSDIYLQQGAYIIYADPSYSALLNWVNYWDPFSGMYIYGDSGTVIFNIPSNAPIGPYDVVVNTYGPPFPGMPTVNTLPNGFTIGTPDGTIQGSIYFDLDQDGTRDVNEFGMSYGSVTIAPDNDIVYLNSQGEFIYYADSGSYVTSVNLPGGYTQTSSPVTYSATVPPSVTGQDFGVFSPTVAYAHTVNIYRSRIRCNEVGNVRVTLYNTGRVGIQNHVTIITSSNFIFAGSTVTPDYSMVDTLVYYTPVIPPGTDYSVGGYITFTAPAAFQTVTISVIDSMFDTGGTFRDVKYDTFTYEVRCSYDPNDKHVNPEGVLAQHYTPINSELTYLINFQNTGNDTAYNITVFDTLDSDLDPATFEVVSSSHLLSTQRTASGAVRFNFFNIMLPDSGTDEPGSHGWVLYRVRPDASLPDPTEITNTAYIVFDLNAPIITNTTLNTMTALQYPGAAFNTADVSICETNCILFNNQSTSGSSYYWSFPGGSPSSSTSASPGAICYLTAGSYDVTLITTNALGSDTLTQSAYINVATSPGVFSVVQSGDSLIAPQGYSSYQWYYNNVALSGDTLYFHIALLDGDYGVVVANPNGCQSGVNIPNVIIGLSELADSKAVTVYPNPSDGHFEISYNSMTNETGLISIIDKLGRVTKSVELNVLSGQNKIVLNTEDLSSGIYNLQIKVGSKIFSKILMINK